MQPLTEVAADPRDVLELSEQSEWLRAAMTALTEGERQAIETTFFAGLTHAEAAVRLNQPLGTIKMRIRSGLHKLRHRLTWKRKRHEYLKVNALPDVQAKGAVFPPYELTQLKNQLASCA